MIKGLKIKTAGKYLAVLLIEISPYKYGFLIWEKPDLFSILPFTKTLSKKLNLSNSEKRETFLHYRAIRNLIS